MNYMEQVAKMIGVKLDEEFKVKNSKTIYKINTNGLFYLNIDKEWASASYMLMIILAGQKEIEKKNILDESEKEYLSNVIKPFRVQVDEITKLDNGEYEYIAIWLRNIDGYTMVMYFPRFIKGTMYKGMKSGKGYSLNELEL